MSYVFSSIFATILLISTGCGNTKAATKATAHATIDTVCTVAHKGVDLAFGPIEDVQADAGLVIEGAKSLVK